MSTLTEFAQERLSMADRGIALASRILFLVSIATFDCSQIRLVRYSKVLTVINLGCISIATAITEALRTIPLFLRSSSHYRGIVFNLHSFFNGLGNIASVEHSI
jgi:hypothetical protein